MVQLNPPRSDGNITGKILNIVKRAQQPRELTTRLKVDNRGHAWAIDPNDSEKPIYIQPQDLNSAKDGDLVLVRAAPPTPKGIVGKVINVLERAPEPYEVTGILEIDSAGKAIVHNQRSNALTAGTLRVKGKTSDLKPFEKDSKPILIKTENLNGAKNGDIVQVLATPSLDGKSSGKVLSIIAKGAFREGSKGASLNSMKPIDWDKVVVLDNGSGMVKAGFAGEEKPRSVFSSVIGRPMSMGTTSTKALFCGEEALSKVLI